MTSNRLSDDFDLIIFDFDDTLVRGWSEEFAPGVTEWFTELAKEPKIPNLAVATNQGGVGLRHWMEVGNFGDPNEYPTQADVETRLFNVLRRLPLRRIIHVYVCYAYQSKKSLKWAPTPKLFEGDPRWDPANRKPEPGMLLRAMKDALAKPERTLMIGDSMEDMLAAMAADCHFAWTKEVYPPWEGR